MCYSFLSLVVWAELKCVHSWLSRDLISGIEEEDTVIVVVLIMNRRFN